LLPNGAIDFVGDSRRLAVVPGRTRLARPGHGRDAIAPALPHPLEPVMQPDVPFATLNYGILVPWFFLVLLPRARVTHWLTHAFAVPIALGLLYTAVMTFAPMPPSGPDLERIRGVLGSPWGATAMWIHALAFDLFVGAWISRDAMRRGIRHLWVAPCLVLTLMLGPAGLVAYLAVRRVQGRPEAAMA
jgi:hypothetical protein